MLLSAAPNEELNKKERGILMLLSIFATTITYTAGLNPPGGFWADTQDGHRGSDPVLNDHHRRCFTAFFISNTVSFVASLGAIMLLLTNNFSRRIFLLMIKPLNKKFLNEGATKFLPQVCIWISLLSLVVAYATGSCRAKDSTTGVLAPYLGVKGNYHLSSYKILLIEFQLRQTSGTACIITLVDLL